MGFWDDVGNSITGHNDFQARDAHVDYSNFEDLNADSNKKSLAAALASRQGVGQAPLVTGPSDSSFRGNQQNLIGALTARANGTAPSLAQAQMKQGLDAEINAQRAQAASQRGISGGLAARLAANNIAGAQQATNVGSGMARIAEQTQAQDALGQALAGARGQDLSQAGLAQQAQIANQGAVAQHQAGIDEMTKYYTNQGMSIDQATFLARQNYASLLSSNHNATTATNAGISSQNAQGLQRFVGSAAGAVGAAAA